MPPPADNDSKESIQPGGVKILTFDEGSSLQEGRATHAGRKAILLTRVADTTEIIALANTMGIEVLETVLQRGNSDPRSHLGKGRIEEVADALRLRPPGHEWEDVDLVIVNTNATVRQLVTLNDRLGIECWDRVRLLLNLFISHASSPEARLQVRRARVEADRAVLREIVRQETEGERLGWGAGGQHAWGAVLDTVTREAKNLAKRQQRYRREVDQRMSNRRRRGVRVVGLAGYTNAGKSSLFAQLSGRSVVADDRLFATLDTTVSRLTASPRVLLVDTIGFIDELPSELMEAMHATLSESLGCDLLLLLLDGSDDESEMQRKLSTSLREVNEHSPGSSPPSIQVVLTKADLIDPSAVEKAREIAVQAGTAPPIITSSKTGEGFVLLREVVLNTLFGSQIEISIRSPTHEDDSPLDEIASEVHRVAAVDSVEDNEGGRLMRCWLDIGELERIISRYRGQIIRIGNE